MKTIRYSLIVAINLIIIFTFGSCADDDSYTPNYKLDIATVNAIDTVTGSFYLTLDNGSTLLPVSFSLNYKPEYNKRAIVNYTLLSDQTGTYDHTVRINAIQNILTKEVIDLNAENAKDIGNDPIKILDLWTGGHFLNINFGYNTNGEKIHTINLVRNTLDKINANPNGTIVLEFRHNANGDPQKYGAKDYAAFNLQPFEIEGKDSVKFIIKVLDFNNETKTYPVTYTYK